MNSQFPKGDYDFTTSNNEWKTIPQRKSFLKPKTLKNQNVSNKPMFYSNRFQILSPTNVECDNVINDWGECDKAKGHENVSDYDNDNAHENVNGSQIKETAKDNTLTTIRKRPQVVINSNPERVSDFVKRNTSGGIEVNKNIKVLCDSIPKGIRSREFSNCFNYNGKAHIKSFPGSTTKQLNYYSVPTLSEEKPEIVILHVGINDMLSDRENTTPDDEIASEIIKIGKKCIASGVRKVFVSSLVHCKHISFERLRKVNGMIKEQSVENDFIFIENNNIDAFHLSKDGIHLQEPGKVILAQNFIDYVNNFLYYRNHPIDLT